MSCAASPALTVAYAQTRTANAGARAIAALNQAKQLEASGAIDKLSAAYHSDAMVVEPGALTPHMGRAAIGDRARATARERKLLYHYYRQPQALVVGNAALVVSNYESGYQTEGQVVEETGKSSNVVLLGPDPPLVALEVLVPNYYGGPSYGPLGTPLTPHFGVFPVRGLPAPTVGATGAGGGENDVLYSEVKQINDAWVTGNVNDLLNRANRSGVFLIGDYSPFYITGTEDIKQHFADFYRTSKVNFIRALDPTVRIWGDVAAVAFNFDLDYTINGKNRRSPGRGVYTFTRGGAAPLAETARAAAAPTPIAPNPPPPWSMGTCAASHLVLRTIGDPYPIAAA